MCYNKTITKINYERIGNEKYMYKLRLIKAVNMVNTISRNIVCYGGVHSD